MSKYILNTDGGARGNPGPAGIGFVISRENGEFVHGGSAYIGEATNNYAEYKAAIIGLKALKKIIPKNERKKTSVVLKMDSELIVKQLNDEYQIKEESLFPLFIEIHNIRVADFPNLSVIHVPRTENVSADKLVNEAIDEHLNN